MVMATPRAIRSLPANVSKSVLKPPPLQKQDFWQSYRNIMTGEEKKVGGKILADILEHKFSMTNRKLMCQLFSPGSVGHLARSRCLSLEERSVRN